VNQLRSELRKVLSTKTWFFLGLGAVFLVLVQTVATFFVAKSGTVAGATGGNTLIGLEDPAGVQNLYANAGASQGYMFTLILGVVAMTSEFRFATIVPTFLTTPQRPRPVLAKVAALGIIGGAIGLAVVVAVYGTTTILLATTPHAPVNFAKLGTTALGAMLAFVLTAVVGVALGALLRNQIVGIVLAVLWVFILEGVITALLTLLWHLDYIAKWLPASAVGSVVSATSATNSDTLPPWAGALVLLAYTGIFLLAAFGITLRRDVA